MELLGALNFSASSFKSGQNDGMARLVNYLADGLRLCSAVCYR